MILCWFFDDILIYYKTWFPMRNMLIKPCNSLKTINCSLNTPNSLLGSPRLNTWVKLLGKMGESGPQEGCRHARMVAP